MAIEVTEDLDFRDITVQLSGEDGNVFSIIGRCKRAISRGHGHDAAKRWSDKAMSAESYDEVLQFCMATLDVE
jgi:hypothetical protein